jgi:hypothetical protein
MPVNYLDQLGYIEYELLCAEADQFKQDRAPDFDDEGKIEIEN